MTIVAQQDESRPDLKNGVPATALPDGGKLVGRVDDDDVVLLRRGSEFFAFGAYCTHYHGPLAEGLVAGETVRCPWHHACFNIRTGEALHAPALDPIPCWRVERRGDVVFVRERLHSPAARAPTSSASPVGPSSVVIIGGGAAGLAAADRLRREGYAGRVTLISADSYPPCDRPNLSKDYLAGTASEDWIPLRPPEYYTERRIDLALDTRVAAIDTTGKRVQLVNGAAVEYGTLLIATGADPVHLEVPGASASQVLYLRTFADSRAIVARAATAKRVVVVGASFIGLEVAASLRARKIEVDVVGPDSAPLERVLGAQVGRFVQDVHESHGVKFHLGRTVNRVDGSKVTLSDGSTVEADFLVLGVGVRPSLDLATKAGLTIDRGVLVNEYLETSVPGIFAAGDIARWPDRRSGTNIRVEHWVVAERQGQIAALNMLGRRQRFDAVPFFWSAHYDTTLNYVGHAEKWDSIEIDGSLAERNCTVRYKRGNDAIAVVTIGRDLESLRAELAMEG